MRWSNFTMKLFTIAWCSVGSNFTGWTLRSSPIPLHPTNNAQKSLFSCYYTYGSLYPSIIHIFNKSQFFPHLFIETNFNARCIVDAHLNPLLLIQHSSLLSLFLLHDCLSNGFSFSQCNGKSFRFFYWEFFKVYYIRKY